MDIIEKIAEEKIKAAMENGEFDNLPGRGKPHDLRNYFAAPAHLRMAFSLLKNAGIVPDEVRLKKELEELRERRGITREETEIARLNREINQKTAQLNMLLERAAGNRAGVRGLAAAEGALSRA